MKIIGIGAAGNKSVWEIIQNYRIVGMEDVMLMNSTSKDFPKEAGDRCCLISDIGGCGKERSLGKEIMEGFLSSPTNVDRLYTKLIKTEGEHIVIVTSMAGGTGSGASSVLAKFCYERYKADVTIIAFKGFGDDLRELENTIEFLKDLDKNLIVQIIDNSAFLDQASNNKIEAEKLANKDLARRIANLSGELLIESEQNIDQTDLFKLITYPGYQEIVTCNLKNVNNSDDMNKAVKNMISGSKSLTTTPSASCMGVIFNVNPETLGNVDFSFKLLKEKYGNTQEFFTHIQYCEDSDDESEWMTVIVSGLKLPMKGLKELYQQYLEMEKSIDTTDDEFFNTINKINFNNTNNRARDRHRGRVRISDPPMSNGTFTPNTVGASKSEF